MSENNYITIKYFAEFEYTVERSRFIGYAKPVSSAAQAEEFIKEIRSKHHDARHNCFAYLLRDGVKRCSDDGEPSGTAGLPMLDILERENIEDAVLVVTRYFGGVLLGTGGLVRAYSKASKSALEEAQKILMEKSVVFKLICDYQGYDKIIHFLKENGCVVLKSDFNEKVEIVFYVKASDSDIVSSKIYDFAAGKISAEKLYCQFLPSKQM